MLHGFQLNAYLSLKKKARIIVPDSATLIGVCDSTGLLEPNEVYIQIRRDSFRCKDSLDQRAFDRKQIDQMMDGES